MIRSMQAGPVVPPTDPSYPFQQMDVRDAVLREVFDRLLAAFKPTIVCDVGAFNGDETFRFSGLLPDSSMVAFEANPLNYRQFYVENGRFNDVPNVRIENLAVSDHVGDVTFNVLDADDSAADWRRAASSLLPRTDGLSSTALTVPCTTLDEYFGVEKIASSTFALWIDVEGALDKVLGGASRVLASTLFLKAEIDWKEFWAGQPMAQNLISMIEAAGFKLIGDTRVEHAYDQSDVLFINNNFLSLLCGERD